MNNDPVQNWTKYEINGMALMFYWHNHSIGLGK